MTGRLPVKQACHPGIENWIPAFAGMTKKRTGSGREKKIMAVGRALRISVRIEAEIVRNEVRCEAVIENLSDEGMMVTTFPNNAIDLSCGSKFDMEFKILVQKAKEIKAAYAELNKKKGEKNWGFAQYAQGLVGDIGALMKLIMAKEGFRTYDDIDKKLAHELADCLWSIIVLADELSIDLESEFLNTMEELQKRISN